MLSSLFILLVLLPHAWLVAAPPVAYPLSYSGGVGRTIFSKLTLLSPVTYTYDEWTHAGYAVHDSGHYEARGQRLRLSSTHSVHKTTNNWQRVNGHRMALPDAVTFKPLFRRTSAHLNVDTVVITKRRVLYNQEFNMVLVKDK